MKGWVKKLVMILGVVASLIVIGSSVSGWIGEKDTVTDTGSDTTTEASVVTDILEAQRNGRLFHVKPATRSDGVEFARRDFLVDSTPKQRVVVSTFSTRSYLDNITATSGRYRKTDICWAVAHA